MTFSVHISKQAADDLRGIFEYIAFSLHSAEAAELQLMRLETGIKSLSSFPQRFKLYEKEPWKGRGLRMMLVNHYLVYYICNSEQKNVHIIRVIYGGRDMDGLLRDALEDF